MTAKTHWETIYRTKAPSQVSWYQDHAVLSLQVIRATNIDLSAQIIDVGGGTSKLVDDLLENGFTNITILDVAATALRSAQERLGERAAEITWIEADVTHVDLPNQFYEVWHDRAVFHFLTQPDDRQRYVDAVRHAVKPGGHVIVATFAPNGPPECSGLEVMRYSAEGLHNEFGSDFELLHSAREDHVTPFGTVQKFMYCYCRRR